MNIYYGTTALKLRETNMKKYIKLSLLVLVCTLCFITYFKCSKIKLNFYEIEKNTIKIRKGISIKFLTLIDRTIVRKGDYSTKKTIEKHKITYRFFKDENMILSMNDLENALISETGIIFSLKRNHNDNSILLETFNDSGENISKKIIEDIDELYLYDVCENLLYCLFGKNKQTIFYIFNEKCEVIFKNHDNPKYFDIIDNGQKYLLQLNYTGEINNKIQIHNNDAILKLTIAETLNIVYKKDILVQKPNMFIIVNPRIIILNIFVNRNKSIKYKGEIMDIYDFYNYDNNLFLLNSRLDKKGVENITLLEMIRDNKIQFQININNCKYRIKKINNNKGKYLIILEGEKINLNKILDIAINPWLSKFFNQNVVVRKTIKVRFREKSL